MRIERMLPEHLLAVAELERLCFSEPWSERSLELLLSETALGVVALEEERVIAYGGMLLAPGEGQITNLATHPDFRRCGAGRAVLCALIQRATEASLEQISLEVRTSNEPAIALYAAEGFIVAGRRPRFYRAPSEDALVMLLPLQARDNPEGGRT